MKQTEKHPARGSALAKKSHNQAGFMLIEIIMTLLIIGVVFVLYQAALGSVVVSKNSKDQELALRIATHKIEDLRNIGYDNLPASGSFTDSSLSSLPSGAATFTVAAYNAKTKSVNVTVSWQEPNSTSHSIELDTLITQVGGL